MLRVVPDNGLAPPCAGARPGNNSDPAAATPACNNRRRRTRRPSEYIFLALPDFARSWQSRKCFTSRGAPLRNLVRTAGLEPAPSEEEQILSLLRLPFRHVRGRGIFAPAQPHGKTAARQ